MGIFDKVKKTTIASRRYEEKLYEVALEEFENDEIRKGLYSKALSKADGDKEKADGIYLKLRVQSIMDDVQSEQINRREDARAFEKLQELRELETINVKKEELPKAYHSTDEFGVGRPIGKTRNQALYSIDGITFKSKKHFDAYTRGLEKAISLDNPDAKAALKKRIEDAVKAVQKRIDAGEAEDAVKAAVKAEQKKLEKAKIYSIDGIKFRSKKDFEAYINLRKD